jgi:hypothetical protein
MTITTFIAGFIGMALSYGLSLNMSLVLSIRNQCTLANYIISVERLYQYMWIKFGYKLVCSQLNTTHYVTTNKIRLSTYALVT